MRGRNEEGKGKSTYDYPYSTSQRASVQRGTEPACRKRTAGDGKPFESLSFTVCRLSLFSRCSQEESCFPIIFFLLRVCASVRFDLQAHAEKCPKRKPFPASPRSLVHSRKQCQLFPSFKANAAKLLFSEVFQIVEIQY